MPAISALKTSVIPDLSVVMLGLVPSICQPND
jgi:hypothetical protein